MEDLEMVITTLGGGVWNLFDAVQVPGLDLSVKQLFVGLLFLKVSVKIFKMFFGINSDKINGGD